MDTNLTRSLEREWMRLTSGRHGRRLLSEWATAEPALADIAETDDLIARCWDRTDVDRSTATLGAIARLARTRADAKVALLVALGPGIGKAGRRYANLSGPGRPWDDTDELRADLATNILLRLARDDVDLGDRAAIVLLSAATWRLRHEYDLSTRSRPTIATDEVGRVLARDADGRTGEELALPVIAEAVAAGDITPADATLLVRTSIIGDPVDRLAEEAGVSVPTFLRRRSRSLRALRGALAAA